MSQITIKDKYKRVIIGIDKVTTALNLILFYIRDTLRHFVVRI